MLRRLLAPLLILLVSSAIAQTAAKPGQSPGQPKAKISPLVPYAGNWASTFEGKPWMLLNLNLVEEQFSGSMQRAKHIDLNDNGEIKRVSEEFSSDQLVDGKLNPDGLLLTFKDSETQETFRYLMKMTGDVTAEIKMIAMEMPPGMPKPKPWKLTKAAPATSHPQR
jgi:hypothetical protein